MLTPPNFEAINTMVLAICEVHVRGLKCLYFYRYPEIVGKMDMNADATEDLGDMFNCVLQKVSMGCNLLILQTEESILFFFAGKKNAVGTGSTVC